MLARTHPSNALVLAVHSIFGIGLVACSSATETVLESEPAPITLAVQPAISAGAFHVCRLKTDGSVACWGDNGEGETSPPAVAFSAISAGINHTCGMKNDGSIACWGGNQ